ncbi:MAG: HlyD family efflux transporter periplasmic adaptor subunit [Candidatus Limivicinus sp.]|nr:HlyD family efflux transporter periplasmic adaptor subunit [Clostridiales bacterium]MCI7137264.1 HlyD family efflux transporter periplasmic adaptor subunit [Clostridiales bacterium]MDY6133687.1 HlyD family efflux transporter periplasmic adaptor subunit [Candidatus Limivicinus sp.]
MEVKVKNRGWVKNAAIIFLAVMLVLTFFSNTFMNHSLAEVATQSVTNGSITAKVRGTGTVESNGSYQVKAGATREIRAVMVKEGQEVNQGDVLFVLGEGPSEELDAATENLRQLQLSYQRTAVNMPSFDYSLDERNIEKAKETLASAQAAENSAKAALEQNANVPEAELKAAQARLDSANQALTDARAELQTRYDAALVLRDQAQARLQELLNNKPEEPEEGSEEDSSYQQQLAAAQAELDAANALLESLDPSVDPTVKAAQAEADAAQEALDAILNRAGPYAESYNQAVEARKAAEDELFTLEYNLNQAKIQNNKTAAAAALELQDMAQQIEKAKKQLAELSGGEDNQVTANVGGIIESIAYTAGSTAPKDEVLCTIQVPDMGYSLSFSVTNEQARRLRVGDSASVTNYYWGSEITATLTNIKTDPKNPQTSKLLTFDLSGDVNAGSELTISVGQKSQNYEIIIPNSAIRTDSNGSYVLTVEAKNSPLGNRYIAQRVDIEVVAADDVNSAVTGDLSYGDFVITTSNKPVQKGDQVRMADGN